MTCGAFLYNNEKNIEDNDELEGLSSSSTLQEKNQKTTMSLSACRRLLQLKKEMQKNDNEPRGLLLSFELKKNNQGQ
jgi:hypothetical protein